MSSPATGVRAGGGAMGITRRQQGARRRHRRPRIPARHPRHGRRRGADERRRLWPRGRGHPGRGDARPARRRASRPGRARRFGYTYRHSEVPEGAVVVEALFEGVPGERARIAAEMDRIAAEREASQPLRSRTGGSTFKNPPGHQGLEADRRRRLPRPHASAPPRSPRSIATSCSTSAARPPADIEALGEEVRAAGSRERQRGHALEWEIQRVGVAVA